MSAAALWIAAALTQGVPELPPIVEYVRANPDGSEAERILVYRPAPERVEVAKLRARCTSAAWVVGEVDRVGLTTRRLEAGRLLPGAERRVVGTLEHRDWPPSIAVRLGDVRQSLAIPAGAWHLYDFDLASLSAVLDGGPAPRRTLRFAMPLGGNCARRCCARSGE